ncbi:MAG: ClbS/DfsB family four-helix bundle protein [Chloroflexi bacterium]|nr:MAG: ClbS/DfsB family four-helix bundle protein [Chloroflexota bacterium]
MSHTRLKPMLLDFLNTMQTTQQTLVTELNDTERAAIGTPVHWSARDHVAHITFWKQRLLLKLAALVRNETPPRFDDFDSLNMQVFEEQRERSWSDILLDAEHAHAELLAHLERFTEEDLASSRWFPPEDGDDDVFPEGRPLWDVILGSGYWHPQSHFTQFYLDRNDVLRATQIQEAWVAHMMQREVPTVMRSVVLYNLACFYATTNQVAIAREVLPQALALNPALTEYSKQDPDLASLRAEQAHQDE